MKDQQKTLKIHELRPLWNMAAKSDMTLNPNKLMDQGIMRIRKMELFNLKTTKEPSYLEPEVIFF